MIPCYMDHNAHGKIIAGLRRREIDCLTALQDGHAMAPDDELLRRAHELQRVMFSHDDDMLKIAAAWMNSGTAFSGLVYGAQQMITIGGAIRDLEYIALASSLEELKNMIQYLPL